MTLSSRLSKLFGVEASNIPNKFTIGMGELIKKARIEAGLTQAELAEIAYFHQASISQIEAGKREVTSSELLSFSVALKKPFIYFLPEPYRRYFDSQDIPPGIQELLLVAQDLNDEDLKRLIIQARALVRSS